MGADEEQPAVSNLGQGQSVMEVSDAAGAWKILQTQGKYEDLTGWSWISKTIILIILKLILLQRST